MVIEQIALLHQRAFAEVHGLDGTGDARAHFDALNRLEPAGELVPQRDVALLDDRDRHRNGRRLLLRGSIRPGFAAWHRNQHRPSPRQMQPSASTEEAATK